MDNKAIVSIIQLRVLAIFSRLREKVGDLRSRIEVNYG